MTPLVKNLWAESLDTCDNNWIMLLAYDDLQVSSNSYTARQRYMDDIVYTFRTLLRARNISITRTEL